MPSKYGCITFCMVFIFCSNNALSQEQSNNDLAKQAQNPVANLISLPVQNNTNLNIGPDDETQNILNIQPVWPFEITENLNFFCCSLFH